MPITLRGSSFQATVNHEGNRYRRLFSTHRDAEIWELHSKAALLAGGLPKMGNNNGSRVDLPNTVGELAEYTMDHHWAGSKSEAKMEMISAAVVLALGENTPITAIDVVAIDGCKQLWKSRGNSPATMNRKLSALSKMLNVALDRGFLKEIPKVQKFREEATRIRWFTNSEKLRMEASLKAAGHAEYWELVQVLLETGMRCGELLGLIEQDVQPTLIVLEVTKNSSPRSIPMTSAVKGIMLRNIKEHGSPFGWTNYTKFKRIWDQMRTDLGWADDEQATPHACRHTYISNLVQLGTPIAMVQRLAGHKAIQMTLRYTHLEPDNLSDVMALFEESQKKVYSPSK